MQRIDARKGRDQTFYPAGNVTAAIAMGVLGPLVAIQILDGAGAGIFGVVSVLVIADLTRGGPVQSHTGAIGTAVGIGASLSQVIAIHRAEPEQDQCITDPRPREVDQASPAKISSVKI